MDKKKIISKGFYNGTLEQKMLDAKIFLAQKIQEGAFVTEDETHKQLVKDLEQGILKANESK